MIDGVQIVIVTGSRDHAALSLIETEICRARPVHLILGDCKTGADAIALLTAKVFNISRTICVADWDTYGDSAGPRRNSDMILAALDACFVFKTGVICLGFPLGKASGTRNCMSQARNAGIFVKEFSP